MKLIWNLAAKLQGKARLPTIKKFFRKWQIGREEINYISINKSGNKLAAADDDGRIRVVPIGKNDKGGVKVRVENYIYSGQVFLSALKYRHPI